MADSAKIIRTAAEEMSLTYDEKRWIAYGFIEGFNVFITSGSYAVAVNFCVCGGDGLPVNESVFAGCTFPKKSKTAINKHAVSVSVPITTSSKTMLENIRSTVYAAADALGRAGCSNCDLLGLTGEVELYSLKGDYVYLTPASASQAASGLQMEIEGEAMKVENPVLGTVGALVGSLLGFIVILIIGRLGRISILGGFVMGLASIFGYKKLGQKIGKLGSVICIIISVVMTYLAFRMDSAIDLYGILNDESEKLFTFGECFRYTKEIFEFAGAKGTYIRNLLMMMLAGVGGAVACVWAENKGQKTEKEFVKIS